MSNINYSNLGRDSIHSYDGGEWENQLTDVIRNSSTASLDNTTFSSNVVEHSKVNPSKGTSWYSAVFLVINAALGAGLLNFPKAYDQAGGIVVAFTVQVILLFFVVAALIILSYCSDRQQCSTYQEVVKVICGRAAHVACMVAVIMYCYGTCITFQIIIGDQFDRVFYSYIGPDFCRQWYLSRDFTITITSIILILPFCFPKRIDFLKYMSIFGVVAVLYVVIMIVYKYYDGPITPGVIKTHPTKWTDVFLVMPAICFGYQCHVSCVPVYSCLADRRVATFLRTVLLAMLFCAIIYTVAATYGYLTFGSLVDSDILESYDANSKLVLVAIVAIIIKTITTYPILLFCGRTAIEDLYIQLRKLEGPAIQKRELLRRIVTVVIWFTSSLFLSILIPNIGIVIQFLGSLAAVFIFVFPGLCLLMITIDGDATLKQRKNKLLTVCSMLFIAIGMFIFGVVVTQAILDNYVYPQDDGEQALCKV